MFGSLTSAFNSFADQASQVTADVVAKAKTATADAVEIAGKAQEKLASKLEEAQREFQAEEAKNQERITRAQELDAVAVPLWTISFSDATATNATNATLEGELKQLILQICIDDKCFLECPLKDDDDVAFPFAVEVCERWALKAMENDPLLQKTRYRLVRPKGLTDFQFWRAYFYKVFQLRTSLGVSQLFDPSKPPKGMDSEDSAGIKQSTLTGAMTDQEEQDFSNELNKFIEEDSDDFVKVGEATRDEKEEVEDGKGQTQNNDVEDAGDELELENLEEMLADVEVDTLDDAGLEAELSSAIEADLP